ncbi:hypothetical protein OnM2_075013 [Erysiphe neolycopersici]|uniref:Uncharacterized protein n=1 Tax=Erysiphe neolycopersici TaxID=212602 RepID=A0A420HIV5_9PEZI|nr:hypothetical protein OnM2_075013 [Erysiphe neolycopersici]
METLRNESKKGKRRHTLSDHENKGERFHEGKVNSHLPTDNKDQRTVSNKLAEAARRKEQDVTSEETRLLMKDPTLPAKMHGNKPSRGAEIDAEIQREEQEELRRKGKA